MKILGKIRKDTSTLKVKKVKSVETEIRFKKLGRLKEKKDSLFKYISSFPQLNFAFNKFLNLLAFSSDIFPSSNTSPCSLLNKTVQPEIISFLATQRLVLPPNLVYTTYTIHLGKYLRKG